MEKQPALIVMDAQKDPGSRQKLNLKPLEGKWI
jgi:hypothetical protein